VKIIPKQFGFVIDLSKCIGCRGCEMACQSEHHLFDTRRRKIIPLANHQESVFSYLSMSCNHCANPACISVCPNRCFQKRRDGIVLHNPQKCDGCKSCVGACPFGAPVYNQKTGKIDKCNLCIDRLDQGLEPTCISSCISKALQVINLSDSDNNFSKAIPGIKMARFTNPSVRFILPTDTKCFWIKD